VTTNLNNTSNGTRVFNDNFFPSLGFAFESLVSSNFISRIVDYAIVSYTANYNSSDPRRGVVVWYNAGEQVGSFSIPSGSVQVKIPINSQISSIIVYGGYFIGQTLNTTYSTTIHSINNNNLTIKKLVNPVDNSDAVSLGYLQTNYNNTVSQMVAGASNDYTVSGGTIILGTKAIQKIGNKSIKHY
jgi:hypothetical protein